MPWPNDDRDGLRRCRDCQTIKPVTDFPRNRADSTGKEFEQLLAAQGGVCGICGSERPEHVDHDHVSGYIRMNKAIAYLTATSTQFEVQPGAHLVLSPRPGMHPVRRPRAGRTR